MILYNLISSASERLYSHLRITDPNLTFIENKSLDEEKLIGEIDNKISLPVNTIHIESRLLEIRTTGTKSASMAGDSNN